MNFEYIIWVWHKGIVYFSSLAFTCVATYVDERTSEMYIYIYLWFVDEQFAYFFDQEQLNKVEIENRKVYWQYPCRKLELENINEFIFPIDCLLVLRETRCCKSWNEHGDSTRFHSQSKFYNSNIARFSFSKIVTTLNIIHISLTYTERDRRKSWLRHRIVCLLSIFPRIVLFFFL
jgi:hypothetical protein